MALLVACRTVSQRRALSAAVLLLICIGTWIHRQSRPPYELYERAYEWERQSSLNLIASNDGLRYVKFNQLHAIGFNNQVCVRVRTLHGH